MRNLKGHNSAETECVIRMADDWGIYYSKDQK